MGFIPGDLYKLGRQTFAIERKANVFDAASFGDVIASTTGIMSVEDDGYKFAGASASSPESGFTTRSFKMTASGRDIIVAAELQLDALLRTHPSAGDRIIFSDGTNSITIFPSGDLGSGGPFGDTSYTAVIGARSVTGVLSKAFNFGADYRNSRGWGAASYVRINPRFRVDKNRGEVSLWLNDQIKGAAAVAGLEAFGECRWQYIHIGDIYSRYVTIKQIGLRFEC